MEVQFLGEGELGGKFNDMVSNSIEVCLASAFLNFPGLSVLETYLKKHNFVKVQILLDENFHPNIEARRNLLFRLLGRPNTEVKIYCDNQKLFRSKIYFFKERDRVHVVF